jgi:outer membrane immunogenic protein
MLRCVAVAGVLLLSVPALATVADANQPDPWTGFSVSIGGGAAKVDSDLAASASNSDNLSFAYSPWLLEFIAEGTGQANSNIDSWKGFGTLQGGYDARYGKIVIGALADFDFYPGDPSGQASSDMDGTFSVHFNGQEVFGPVPFSNYASLSSSLELKNTWSVGGRLGYLITPSTLIYGLGGYSQASLKGQVDLSYDDLVNGAQTLSLRTADQLSGYFLGGGGEMLITPGVALRLEYRYANYSGEMSGASASTDVSANLGGGTVSYTHEAAVKADLDAQIHTIRGAVVFKLGEP